MQNLDRYKYIFRAYDIRGILEKDMSCEVMYRIGQSLAFLQREDNKSKIFVSGDIRKTSDMLTFSLIAGITSQGIDVIYSGKKTPFGVTMFSGWYLKADSTAFVTASHLPPEWNGVKFYHADGVGFSEELNLQIRDQFLLQNEKTGPWQKTGQISIANAEKEYIEFLAKRFTLEKSKKVVLDCGNGSTALIAPKIFKLLGYEVIELYCTVDPLTPQRDSEPNEESLKMLSETVIKEKADFGVGFDGDGDRAIIIDDKGRLVPSDKTGIILAKELIKREKIQNPVIIANVECSLIVEDSFPSATVKRVRVGHTFLTLEAKKYGKRTVIGMESSGHMVIPPIFLFDDSMPIPLLMGDLLSKSEKKLSIINDSIPEFPKKSIKVDCKDEIKFEVIKTLTSKLSSKYNIDTIDGIRITKKDGSWVLIRASNTSPIIRLTIEGRTEEIVEGLNNKFYDIIRLEIENISQ